MDIRHLITFKSIVDNGSFSNAAKILGYSQSTITFQMQQLESTLNIKIFDRIGRNMQLTPIGKELVKYANDLLDNVRKIENLGKQNESISGELKISTAESLVAYKLENVLFNFKQKAPNVKLTLVSHSLNMITDSVLKGETDLGIGYETNSKSENLIYLPMETHPLVFVCSSTFDIKDVDFTIPNQTLDINLVTNEPGGLYRRIMEKYLSDKNIILNEPIELWSLEAIKKCVASNVGVAFLPTFAVEDELSTGKFAKIPFHSEMQTITSICCYHKNKWLNPAMSLFLDLLKEDFRVV